MTVSFTTVQSMFIAFSAQSFQARSSPQNLDEGWCFLTSSWSVLNSFRVNHTCRFLAVGTSVLWVRRLPWRWTWNELTRRRWGLIRRRSRKPASLHLSSPACYATPPEKRGFRNSEDTMVENGKKHRQDRHLIILCPTSERCERTSERTSEWPNSSVCILGCYRP